MRIKNVNTDQTKEVYIKCIFNGKTLFLVEEPKHAHSRTIEDLRDDGDPFQLLYHSGRIFPVSSSGSTYKGYQWMRKREGWEELIEYQSNEEAAVALLKKVHI